MSEATRVDFYFDPLCPWCWRTALWLRDVARRHPISINWKLFSLMVVNHPEEYADEQYGKWFQVAEGFSIGSTKTWEQSSLWTTIDEPMKGFKTAADNSRVIGFAAIRSGTHRRRSNALGAPTAFTPTTNLRDPP